MQTCFSIAILVLQPKRLMGVGDVGFGFEFTPTIVITKPQQLAVSIGHLTRDTDLIAMEVIGLLLAFTLFICPVMNLR